MNVFLTVMCSLAAASCLRPPWTEASVAGFCGFAAAAGCFLVQPVPMIWAWALVGTAGTGWYIRFIRGV